MISSYLVGKDVTWYTLEKSYEGGKPEYIRVHNSGTIKDVSSCGGLCCVIDSVGTYHELETADIWVKGE